MATRTELFLPQAQVQNVSWEDNSLLVHLSEFYSFVSLSGSAEQTQWRQAGTLIVDEAQVEGTLPDGPRTLTGGDIQDGAYTYRDRVPMPIDSRGQVGCVLRIEGEDAAVTITGDRIRLRPEGERRYVKHVRDD